MDVALAGPLREAFERLVLAPDVVELEQIDPFGLESGQRPIEFLGVGRLEVCGDEKLVAQAGSCGDLAQYAFGIAIGRGRVDEPSATPHQSLYDGIGLAPCRFVILIENIGRAKPNCGNALVPAWVCTVNNRAAGF